MSNSFTTYTRSTLLSNKLREIVGTVQSHISPLGSSQYQTFDEALAAVYGALNEFYQNIDEPIFVPQDATYRLDPEKDRYNKNFNAIASDLAVLFNEFENLEDVVLGGFNFMVSRTNRLKGRLKQAASRLGDFFLYSSIRANNYVFVSDSFTNLERVESRSPLLKEPDELEINQEEGIVTLPIDTSFAGQKIIPKANPVINANSNGVVGNNQEYAAVVNYDISKIQDYNADTWFEYERVLNVDDGTPLTLDFTINLGTTDIVNFIRINPNNFGAKTELEVLSIETSADGNKYESVNSTLLAPDLVDPDDNTLLIAPSTSKYAGQGLYSFLPRKVRYIRIALKQSTPFAITTYSGQRKWRYAIGIRDVHIEKRKYKEKGELISKTYSFTSPVRKLVLETEQLPSVEMLDQAGTLALAKLTHSVSPDNGISWHQIRPKISVGDANVVQGIPELLDFNGVAPGTITTKSPISSLRYKLHLERNTEAFTDSNSSFEQKDLDVTELHQTPTTTPFNISLQKTPIDGTVKIIDPFLGSRGLEKHRYTLRPGNSDEVRIILPWGRIYPELSKEYNSGWKTVETSPLNVVVDGFPWTQGRLSSAGADDTYYQVNAENGKLQLGNGVHGKAPTSSSRIEVYLDEERLYPSADAAHIAKFKYPVAPDPKEIEVYFIDQLKSKTVVLAKGAKVHRLDPAISGTIIFSDQTVFSSMETFVDGSVELTSPGQYSVDTENGVVYSYSATISTGDTSVSYQYTPRTKLKSTDYSFVDSGGVTNAISIVPSAWRTLAPFTPETIPTGVKHFGVAHLAIAKGSLKFAGTNASTVFSKEIPFIDGRMELSGATRTTEKLAALTGSGAVTISLSLQIASDTNLGVSFTNSDVFVEEQDTVGAVTSPGDYYIYRTAGNPRVVVYISAAVSDPGYISYYYTDANADLSGVYSVNYETGEIFTYTATISGLTVDYRYTDFRVRYPIARLVSSDDYEVDAKNKTVVIADREIANKHTVERASSDRDYYRVSYKYTYTPTTNVSEYRDFFTPVVASYKLKIVPENRLAF